MLVQPQQERQYEDAHDGTIITFPREAIPSAIPTAPQPVGGIKPLTWFIVVTISLLMWGGILYGLSLLLGVIF